MRAKIKGGNSNRRGPIPTFKVQVSGARREEKPLWDAAKVMSDRLISIFTRDADGRRPCHGRRERFQTDPLWRGLILFCEYFHGGTWEGLGASQQTGWTGLVASLIDEWCRPPQTAIRPRLENRGNQRPEPVRVVLQSEIADEHQVIERQERVSHPTVRR